MAENRRFKLTDRQRFLVILAVVVAFFLAAMALGSSSLSLVAMSAVLLVGAGLTVFLLGVRHNSRRQELATAYVQSVSPAPAGAIVGRCDMRLLVNVPGRAPVEVKFRDIAVPVIRWPKVGQTLPVDVEIGNARHLRIRWDLVELGYVRAPDPTPPRPRAADQSATTSGGSTTTTTTPVRLHTQYADRALHDPGFAIDDDPAFGDGPTFGNRPTFDDRTVLSDRTVLTDGTLVGDEIATLRQPPPAADPYASSGSGDGLGYSDVHHSDVHDIGVHHGGVDDADVDSHSRGALSFDAADVDPVHVDDADLEHTDAYPDNSPVAYIRASGSTRTDFAVPDFDSADIDSTDIDSADFDPAQVDRTDFGPDTDDPDFDPDDFADIVEFEQFSSATSAADTKPDPDGPGPDGSGRGGSDPDRPDPGGNDPGGPDVGGSEADAPARIIPLPRPAEQPTLHISGPGTALPAAGEAGAGGGTGGDGGSIGGMLIVSDLDRSLRFYSEKLGFTIVYSTSGSAVVEYGGARILLQHMADFSGIDRRVGHLHIQVPDVDAAYGDLVAKGVDFSHRPKQVSRSDDLELWKATFRDPDGHGIALTEWRRRR